MDWQIWTCWDSKQSGNKNMTNALVIDDELISQEIAARSLRSVGISNVTCAADGAKGLRILDEMVIKPDLVVCDIFMPEKDGIEIVNALIERKFTGGLILVSGADSQFLQIAKTIAVSHGLYFLGWLSKPMSEDRLQELCRGLSSHSNPCW